MTVLADYFEILGNGPKVVPANQGPVILSSVVDTGGRLKRSAFLMFTTTGEGAAAIFVNGHQAGAVFGSNGVISTQVASFSGAFLNDGLNQVELRDVSNTFRIRNVYCFFHQNSGTETVL